VQPADTLLAPELEQARKRRRIWSVVGCIVLAALLVGVAEYRAVHGWVQGVRSRRMAAKAESELLAGNLEQAAAKAKSAYLIKPGEPSAIRIAARVQGLIGQPGLAVALWRQLLQTGAMKPEDRRPYAESLLMSGAVVDAGMETETLLRDNPGDAAIHRLGARWAATSGDIRRGLDLAARAIRIEPDNLESRLLLAVLQLGAGGDRLREEAIRTLLQLGGEKTREGIEALKRLATLPGLSKEVAEKAIALIREHPLATEEHRFQALSLELAIRPGERTAILDATVKQCQNAEPGAKRGFGVWLNAQGEHERMLLAIPIVEGFKRKDLLLVCLDALASLKRWDEIERILGMNGAPLDTVYKELFLARSAVELGSQTVADLHWKQAHLAAGPSTEQMLFIGNYAEKIGRLENAEAAFTSLSMNADTARVAFEGLLRLARKRGDMEKLRAVLGKMKERWPKDDAVKNDFAYVNLLTATAVDESLAAARELVAASPASMAHRTTLALAALRKNDPAGALSVYRGLSIPWDRVGAPQRAVYAAVLGANGKTAEARIEADAVPRDQLRPEELELIKPWRTP